MNKETTPWRLWLAPPSGESPYRYERVEALRIEGRAPVALGVIEPAKMDPMWNVVDVWWRPAS